MDNEDKIVSLLEEILAELKRQGKEDEISKYYPPIPPDSTVRKAR